jgi:hypothetical protein
MAQQDDRVFAAVELKPVDENDLLWEPTFRVFQIDVKSDTDIGRALHNDPLTVLRENAPEMEINEGARAQVLRVNAERPANPVKRKEVWIVYPDNTTAVGVQYKYLEGE